MTIKRNDGSATVETGGAGAKVPPVVEVEVDDPEPGNGSTSDGMRVTGEPVGDIFDNLDALRIKQDFGRAKIKRPFTSCSIRKPRKHEWFQAHPDPAYRLETKLFLVKEDMSKEWYLPVGDDVFAELEASSLHDVVIFTWINRKKDVCVWPVQLADPDGKENDWHISMREVMSHHATRGQWIRIQAGDQAYHVDIAENEGLPAPEWPPVTLNQILRVAFKGGRLIDSLDHTVITRNLRGSV